LNWHADVSARKSRDQRVPRFTPIEDGVPGVPTTRVANSAGDSRAGALGVSWADAAGFVGASIDGTRNDYGVTVEPDVTIRMRRERLALAGERKVGGAIDGVEFQASRTNYRHVEVEGDGAIGTTFTSRGHELRTLARLRALPLGAGALHSVVGAQAESLDFAALGEEAFVPGTRTRNGAFFALAEWRLPASLALAAGVRVERVRVASDGDAADATEPRFGAATERRFSPTSASFGATLPLAAGWSATAQLGRTQRAPTYYELFANGVHVATGAFEVGDPTLGAERSTHAEIGTQWQVGTSSFKAQLFSTRFANYIALDATGAEVEGLPEYAFRAVPARLHGLEVEGRTRLADRPWTLDVSGALDLVRGTNRASGEPLPRLAPLRARIGLEAAQGPWFATLTVRHLARQDRVPTTDVPTPAATLVDASLAWRRRLDRGGEAMVFLRLDNLGDRLAFNASALRVARELSPLPGRSATLGLRVGW
jgi:iron complex outermembrane receptor protein